MYNFTIKRHSRLAPPSVFHSMITPSSGQPFQHEVNKKQMKSQQIPSEVNFLRKRVNFSSESSQPTTKREQNQARLNYAEQEGGKGHLTFFRKRQKQQMSSVLSPQLICSLPMDEKKLK